MSAEENPSPGGYQHVNDTVVAFNTVVDSEQSFMFGADDNPVLPENALIAYNLVVSPQGPVVVSSMGLEAPDFVGNFVEGELGIDSDPGFIPLAKGALEFDAEGLGRLVADAAPIDAGASLDRDPRVWTPLPSIDVDGQHRDDLPDVGADERRDDDEPCVRPLRAEDVGPSWERR